MDELIKNLIDAARLVAAEILDDHPNIRDAYPAWFRPGTKDLVLALDALDSEEER